MNPVMRCGIVLGLFACMLGGFSRPAAASPGPVVPPVTAGPVHTATAAGSMASYEHSPALSRADLLPAQVGGGWCTTITAVLCGAIGIGSVAAGAATTLLGDTIVKPITDGLVEGLVNLLETGLTWWMTTPTVSVSGSGVFGLGVQALMLGVGMVVATVLLLMQAIRTIVARRGTPLLEAFEGLVKMGFMAAAGVALVNGLALAGDQLTSEIQALAFADDTGMADRLASVLVLHPGEGVMLTLLLTLVAFLVSLVQLVVFFIRQAALPIQALLIPIAAAGLVGGGSSRQWLVRLWAGILALVFYKPAAMLVIAVGFSEVSAGATVVDVVRGLMTLVLSIVALPVLLRMFTPILDGMVGRGGSLLSAAYTGLWAYSALRSRGGTGGAGPTSPAQQERHMTQTGPAAGTPPSADPWHPPERQASTSPTIARGAASALAGAATKAAPAASPVTVAVVAAEAAHRAARRAAEAMTETSRPGDQR